MKYIFDLIIAIIIAIVYFPILFILLLIGNIFTLIEFCWYLKLRKNKEGKYLGAGINIMLFLYYENVFSFSNYKKTILSSFK